LIEQGDPKQALLTYNRALTPRPHAIDALLGKAAALFALKDYDAAKSTAEQAVALDPHNRDGLMLIGSTWEQLGNKTAAQDVYQRCVDQSQDNETHSAPCRKRLVQLDARP
jgi:tetratricopeptide (TPR) repeat protein